VPQGQPIKLTSILGCSRKKSKKIRKLRDTKKNKKRKKKSSKKRKRLFLLPKRSTSSLLITTIRGSRLSSIKKSQKMK